MSKKLEDFFNEYNLKARFFPAFISVIPLVLLKHYFINRYFHISFNRILLGDTSLAVVLIYLFIQINRFISKTFFENKNYFPTDRILLPSSGLVSKEYMKNLAEKIKVDFNLTLPEPQDENTDLKDVQIRIREIVKSIINKVRDGNLLLQHNIEYGFVRNLIAGSTVACVVSLLNMVLFGFIILNEAVFITSMILALVYATPILLSTKILRHYANEYAQVLFREYLSSK